MMDEGFASREVMDKIVGADFVEVMYAKNLEEAKICCNLLEVEQIPARYEEGFAEATDRGIAILVPEASLVEASEILASRVENEGAVEEDEDVYAEDDMEELEDVDEEEELEDDDDDEIDDDEDDDEDEDTDEADEF